MRTIPLVLFLFSVLTSGAAIMAVAGIIYFSTQTILAGEYGPLDLIGDNDSFAVTVGFDRELGRYWTYHYKYAD